MSSRLTRAEPERRQMTMFPLFDSAPRPVRKKQQSRVITETSPVQVSLIRLLRHGYSFNEISQQTNIPASTVHLWTNKVPELKAALAYGRSHGACLRVVEALYDGARRWEEMEGRTGLDDAKLGLALCDLLCQDAVTTQVYVPSEGGLVPAPPDGGHRIMDEVRLYFPGPGAAFYYDPPAASDPVM